MTTRTAHQLMVGIAWLVVGYGLAWKPAQYRNPPWHLPLPPQAIRIIGVIALLIGAAFVVSALIKVS